MKNLLVIFSIIVVFSSCKKKDDNDCMNTTPVTPAATPANNYLKLAVGNYWVYDDYLIDTNGVQTLMSTTDSAYVISDTVIHGNTYHKLFDLYFTEYLRDSSGFIVDTTGKVYFTNSVFNLPVRFDYYAGNVGYNEQMTLSTTVQVTVPAGTFTAYDWQVQAHFTDPNYQWGSVRYAHDYFSEGVGKVKQVYFLYSSPNFMERRLNHYHVQ